MSDTPVVTTESGLVRGGWGEFRSGGSTSRFAFFRGIPFAAAPVGPLRFAAPVAPERWGGERDATSFGPTAQKKSPWDPPRVPEPSIPGDDILTVNITTPDPSGAARLPVLVWIHGGGFEAGSPASPWYVGEAFARDGVVTVTVGYRLGFEGFGWLDDAGQGGVVNNRGVRDWLAALEWVQRNIAAFGGDPARVTIAGQSAGGAAVMRLLTMPSAQHLFAQVLALSPADASASPEANREASRRLAAAVGVETNAASAATVDALAYFEARTAAATPDDDNPGWLRSVALPLPLAPAIDGDLCPTSVTEAVRDGIGADKPLFLSSTLHEFNVNYLGYAEMLAGRTAHEILAYAGLPDDLAADMAADLASRGEDERGPAWALGQAVSDAIFRGPVARWGDLRGDGPTWVADFRWEASPPSGIGAAHCVDLPFGFDILGTPGVREAAGDQTPQALADAVHGDWLRFITSGDVDAPAHASDHATIVYTREATRVVASGYSLERRLMAALSEDQGNP